MCNEQGEKMKVWITKYALSEGITEHEATVINGQAYPGDPFSPFIGFVMGRDAHDTPEGAVVAAMKARAKKICSLKKQLAKLEKMTFSIPTSMPHEN